MCQSDALTGVHGWGLSTRPLDIAVLAGDPVPAVDVLKKLSVEKDVAPTRVQTSNAMAAAAAAEAKC